MATSLKEFLNTYSKEAGVLHIEYGKHIQNNIIVFIDSKKIQKKLPFEFGKYEVNIYNVREVLDDASKIYSSLKHTLDEEAANVANIYKHTILLCKCLLRQSPSNG
jgi:hypothetical protein